MIDNTFTLIGEAVWPGTDPASTLSPEAMMAAAKAAQKTVNMMGRIARNSCSNLAPEGDNLRRGGAAVVLA